MKVIKLKFNKKKITTIWWTGKDLEIFKSCEMSQNDQKMRFFLPSSKFYKSIFLKFWQNMQTLWILLILQKLGQNNDFSRSYDVKRGQKSQKKSQKIKQIDVNQKTKFKKILFFIIFFLNESNKNKILQKICHMENSESGWLSPLPYPGR